MSTTFIGTGFSVDGVYGVEERNCWDIVHRQIDQHFGNQKNLLISLTWFGPQFANSAWNDLEDFRSRGMFFDNVFLLATVDPPFINIQDMQQLKVKTKALRVYLLGNFDSDYEFNFFAPVIGDKFKIYTESEIILENVDKIYVNYNRKPKPHRVNFVKKLIEADLIKIGTVTLGKDPSHVQDQDQNNELYLNIGENNEDYIGSGNPPVDWGFGIPQDIFSLHRMDIWKYTFLYINAATEFEPRNDLFCQQDTFKPMIGLRPFVINGVQRTYRWLRLHGFKTFNHYWSHIDIEHGDVHESIIELIRFLNEMGTSEILSMYADMLSDLRHNRERFFEFAKEQKYKMENLFS
jgi:hypothetical protein